MLGRHLGLLLSFSLLALGCEAGGSRVDSGVGGGMDAGPPAVDSGPASSCTTATDCDDGEACTIDECVVGNVCDYTALDSRCGMDERCVVGRGCVTGAPTDCTDAADCQNGSACDGAEVCIRGMCVPGDAVDCNDNNACTTDTCNDPAGSCSYDTAPGCDAGIIGSDAGPPCVAFDPATHYDAGSYILLPSQSCGAGTDMYSVGNLVFSVSADTLTVRAGRFTLTQSPVPTGASFDVTGSDSCATVRITGTFECTNRLTGNWTATHGATCGACGTTNAAITAVQ